jgi:alpha-mannosidase
MLKLEIPTALGNPKIFAKVPGASIERETNGEEEPYQDWLAVAGQIGGSQYTLGLANDSTYSYDCLSRLRKNSIGSGRSTLKLSCFHSTT